MTLNKFWIEGQDLAWLENWGGSVPPCRAWNCHGARPNFSSSYPRALPNKPTLQIFCLTVKTYQNLLLNFKVRNDSLFQKKPRSTYFLIVKNDTRERLLNSEYWLCVLILRKHSCNYFSMGHCPSKPPRCSIFKILKKISQIQVEIFQFETMTVRIRFLEK